MESLDNLIQLKDGRNLCYAEYGAPDGVPLFYFHGFPSSRLEARLMGPMAREHGVRVIAPDRPGYGLSDFQKGRTIADWPGDVVQLADSLGLDEFGVVGVSGGGPYSLACSRYIADRLHSAGVVVGLGPFDHPAEMRQMHWFGRLGLVAARHVPRLLMLLAEKPLRWHLSEHPERVFSFEEDVADGTDEQVMEFQAVKAGIIASFREAVRQGARGMIWDAILYARSWGFSLKDVAMQVHLWHGESDHIVPVIHGKNVAESLPNCKAHFYPNEGHFSLPVRHMPEILGELIPRAYQKDYLTIA